jgi:hypothetical protein
MGGSAKAGTRTGLIGKASNNHTKGNVKEEEEEEEMYDIPPPWLHSHGCRRGTVDVENGIERQTVDPPRPAKFGSARFWSLNIAMRAETLIGESAHGGSKQDTLYGKRCSSDTVVQGHSGQAILEQPSIALWQPKRLALGRMQNHPTPTTASATSQTPSIGRLPTMFPQLISFVACTGLYLELQDSLILDWRSMDSFGHPK